MSPSLALMTVPDMFGFHRQMPVSFVNWTGASGLVATIMGSEYKRHCSGQLPSSEFGVYDVRVLMPVVDADPHLLCG